ncbi:hypothetical protein [Halobacillus litoralis]|nr:hypothetical protein [Halobacillus litoralis]
MLEGRKYGFIEQFLWERNAGGFQQDSRQYYDLTLRDNERIYRP